MRLLPLRLPLAFAALTGILLTGCGAPSSTTQVSASLGSKSLPGINLPAYVPGPLNGESTARQNALRRPLGVILENYAPDSRPQAGLAGASTVVETLAEGGVTRFLALYLEGDASKVGPVRSTRIYFDRWASGFHAILAHVGGNDDAQAHLWHLPSVFNVDENRWERNLQDTGTPLFWRSRDRAAPHNMYTSTYKLRTYAAKNHQDWAYREAALPHKQAASMSGRAHSSSITIRFTEPLYHTTNPAYGVSYVFDRASDTYRRYMGGAPHIDANTGKQLQPANVVLMTTPDAVSDPAAGVTLESILLPQLQHGRAVFFRDGKVESGTYRQKDEFAPLLFYDHRGRLVEFNPGQTWIEVVPASSARSWTSR